MNEAYAKFFEVNVDENDVPSRLFQAQQALHEIQVGLVNLSFHAEGALAGLGFLGEQVATVGLPEGDLSGPGDFEGLFGPGVSFNLRHDESFLFTLLVSPNRRGAYGTVWANVFAPISRYKRVAKVSFSGKSSKTLHLSNSLTAETPR